VLRIKGARIGVAVTTDCNARFVYLDPRAGAAMAVAEAARNVSVSGGRPLGLTDCLNFGSPERPSVYFQFREACRGIADACRAFDAPVTGGNVSFYNESPSGAVDPTPVVGMVGLLERVDRAVPSHAHVPGDRVVILGDTKAELGGSAYWEAVFDFSGGEPPAVDLPGERRLVDCLVEGGQQGLVRSAHDCSDGGLGIALAEVAMGGPYQERGYGLEIDLRNHAPALESNDLLFSESHGRAVITCVPENLGKAETLARRYRVAFYVAGTVGESDGTFQVRLRDAQISAAVAGLRTVYFTAIPKRMGD